MTIGGTDCPGQQWDPTVRIAHIGKFETHTPDTHPQHYKTLTDTPQSFALPIGQLRLRTPQADTEHHNTRITHPTTQQHLQLDPHNTPLTTHTMAPLKHPRFTERELRTLVDEIVKVESQLFGAQVQHTPIARKMELWQTIVNKVNAVGHHPHTRDDIRKRWNDLRGKVRSLASRHNIAVQ
ncbi:hypothetical protein NDU88_002058 [Pleurodeles waltl]|uniref:Myb/SANT-like DNA-binding domain-containing protein n=1 Tax=Pleurodeles waltl TaxID=8319 RepID=A0AAV7QBU7_PLEWA|nr:hypothetical protein NDU88_002058 [Pleurodeles waltl]